MPLWRGLFSYKYSQNTPHSSPVRARYRVSFMNLASDWYSASVPIIMYAISYYFSPRYNGTRLYSVSSVSKMLHVIISFSQHLISHLRINKISTWSNHHYHHQIESLLPYPFFTVRWKWFFRAIYWYRFYIFRKLNLATTRVQCYIKCIT